MYYHFSRSMISHKQECMNKLHVSSEIEILVSPVSGTYIMQVVELRAGVTYHSFVCNKKCRTGVAKRILIILHQRALWSLFVRLKNRMYIHVKKCFCCYMFTYIRMHAYYKITWPNICNYNWTDSFFSLFVFITFPEFVFFQWIYQILCTFILTITRHVCHFLYAAEL